MHRAYLLCNMLKNGDNTATICTVSLAQKLIQVAQLSQTDCTAGWVNYGQKWKTGTGRQYFMFYCPYSPPDFVTVVATKEDGLLTILLFSRLV